MANVDFIYACNCPNVDAARAQLRQALAAVRVPITVCEWRTDDAALPQHCWGYGSPSILVNETDVASAQPGDGASCRIYAGFGGLQRVPPLEQITAALTLATADR